MLIRLLKIFLIFFVLSLASATGALFFVLNNKCIDFTALEHYNPGKPTLVLDDEGNEWARFQLDRREPIRLSQMPEHLIKAFIATEDRAFFSHAGISWRGIIRSSLVNIYHGRIVQGASTITQQLVKLLFFNSKKTFKRKVKEQLCALLVERQFTKEQILGTYLNHVYFGCGIYGVQAASQRFWAKDITAITIDEAAVLAAIVRSPGNYCPILNPLSAQKRRNVILSKMKELNFITSQEYEAARERKVTVKEYEHNQLAPHLREMIRLFLEALVGKERLYTGGLTIQTTLSRDIQKKAELAFFEQCAKLKKDLAPDIDGALLSLEVKTGEIKAMIGGYDFSASKWNRAFQMKRQIGSIIKPLIYACAIQQGMSFADVEEDEPLELEQANGTIWKPNNFNFEFEGPITLARALSCSSNIVAIKTFLKVGAQPVIDLARKCRLQGELHTYPSLALGCINGTLEELAGMFNVFANGGIYVQPHYIKWVKDAWGKKIWRSFPERERIIDARTCGQVVKVLELALERVRKWMPQKWIDSQAISKTGTTNDCRTCWYTGSTPSLTTALYIGCDDNRSMGKHIYPLRTSFPIWIAVNRELTFKEKRFSFDPSLREISIDQRTGKLVHAKNVRDADAISILV